MSFPWQHSALAVNGNAKLSANSRILFSAVVIGGVVLVDQFSKWLVVVFNLAFIPNTGSAFGLFQQNNFILLIISLVVSCSVIYYVFSQPKQFVNDPVRLLCLLLIAGGGIGNSIDRIRLGYVIDFIHSSFWPSFNLADSSVCIGVIGLIIWPWIRGKSVKREG